MRLSRLSPVFSSACLAFALLLAGTVWGQYGVPIQQGIDIKGWKAAEFQGKIDSTKGTTLTALNFGNERIFIYVMPQFVKTLSIKGTAEPSAIKSGMGVRFAGKVDEKGVVEAKVSELYLVSHDGPILPEFSLNEDTEIAGTIVSNDMKGNLKATVNGTKKEMKGDKEIVLKRVKLVTFQIAEDVKVNVDVKDISLASANDSVTVTGKQVKSNNMDLPNHIVAETLTVEMVEPLTGQRRKPTNKPAEKKEPEKKADAFEAGAKQAADADKKPDGEKKEAPKKEAPAKKDAPKKAEPKKPAEKAAGAIGKRLGED